MACKEVCPCNYFRWCGYFRFPWVLFVTTNESKVRVRKIASRISVSCMSSQYTFFSFYHLFWLNRMAISSISGKPGTFEFHDSLNLYQYSRFSFEFRRMWIFPRIDLFSDILRLCETNLDGSIDSDNLSLKGSFPLIRKDSVTYMHGIVVTYLLETLRILISIFN